MSRVSSYLRLVRLPNLFTAVSNVVGGHVIASGGTVNPFAMTVTCLGSAALYGGGVAMNDFADRRIDAVERPERLLPSGRITPAQALAGGAGLLLVGGLSGFTLSPFAGILSSALAVAVLAYDLLLKRWFVTAPLGMGLCRGLNWTFGLASGGALAPAQAIPPVVLFLHAAGLTALARRESASPGLRRLVKSGILVIPLLDGLLVGAFGHPVWGVRVALFAIPAWVAGRWFEST